MRVRFGEFVLDTNIRELREGDEERHLSGKAFQLLEFLVARSPDAVTKRELYDHIWGDTVVEEVNLANLISEVRAGLGETAREPRFVKTIHGYGYAFIGSVRKVPAGRSRRRKHAFSLVWRREEFPLAEGSNSIGRSDEADVVLDSASISRIHARITVDGPDARLEDLDSKNGSFHRGKRIDCPVDLRDGDEIRLGQVSLLFRRTNRDATTVTNLG